MQSIIPTLLLLPFATAHFLLNYPAMRGFDENKLVQFPCGGQDTPSPNRTLWPLAGGPIQLNMQHDRVAVQVLLGLGNDVGVNYNITLMPTFEEEGFGNFCLGDVIVPTDLGIKDGDNATIQVVTNGDPNGGLYNCADITFTSGPPTPEVCENGTGITSGPNQSGFRNANETDATGASASGTSGSASSSAPAASATGATSSATRAVACGFLSLVVAVSTLAIL